MAGVQVAILTIAMKKILLVLASMVPFMTLPVTAQEWSIGGATGPFVFGKFASRRLRAGTEQPGTEVTRVKLTAKTRPGLAADIERRFNDRFALRLEGTFTRSPLAVTQEHGDSVSLDAGHINVTTLTLPLIIQINPHGTFRFHISGGPAYAIYRIHRTFTTGAQIAPFEGSRSRFGAAGGAGIEWWWSKKFGLQGDVVDIATSSPFEKRDFVSPDSITIPRPHNVHTTIGVRYAF